MKKYMFLMVLVITVTLQSCSVYTTSYVDRLTVGMTIQQVEARYGPPRRVIEARRTPSGFLHVLEYRNRNREVYALEFWDNYLVGYEYLYDDYRYIAPIAPPQYRPSFGTRVVVIRSNPQRPNTRTSSSRNQNRPVSNQRQDSNRTTTRSDNNRSSNTRSTQSTTRESQSNTRESQNNRGTVRENNSNETNRGRAR